VRKSLIPFLLGFAVAAGCHSTPAAHDERVSQGAKLWHQGVDDFNGGRTEEGIKDLRKAVELEPGAPLYRYDLARFLLHRGEDSDLGSMRASEDAKRLHEKGEHDNARRKEEEAGISFRAALVDVREARDHLLWVADVWPTEPNVSFFLMKAYTVLGEYGSAKKYLEKFMELGQPQGAERDRLLTMRDRLSDAELLQEHSLKR
jgi:tetratricopeptide (TPR) repeat protein